MKFRQRFQWNPANSPVRSWPGFQRCYVIAENCDRFEERPRWKPYFGACPSTSHLDTIYFCWPQPREVMIWSFILLISPGLAILSSKLNRTPSKPVDVCAVFASLMLRWWCNNKIECKRSRVGKTIRRVVLQLSSPWVAQNIWSDQLLIVNLLSDCVVAWRKEYPPTDCIPNALGSISNV